MNDKKKKEEDEINIQSNIEETPQGMKKDLKASLDIKGKGIRIKAGRMYIKFPVESAEKSVIEKTDEGIKGESAKIFKGGEGIELKRVHVEDGKFKMDIPAFIQEILSIKKKE